MMVSSEDNYFEKKIVKTFDDDFLGCDEGSSKNIYERILQKASVEMNAHF